MYLLGLRREQLEGDRGDYEYGARQLIQARWRRDAAALPQDRYSIEDAADLVPRVVMTVLTRLPRMNSALKLVYPILAGIDQSQFRYVYQMRRQRRWQLE